MTENVSTTFVVDNGILKFPNRGSGTGGTSNITVNGKTPNDRNDIPLSAVDIPVFADGGVTELETAQGRDFVLNSPTGAVAFVGQIPNINNRVRIRGNLALELNGVNTITPKVTFQGVEKQILVAEVKDLRDGTTNLVLDVEIPEEDLPDYIRQNIALSIYSPVGTATYTFSNVRLEITELEATNRSVQDELLNLNSRLNNLVARQVATEGLQITNTIRGDANIVINNNDIANLTGQVRDTTTRAVIRGTVIYNVSGIPNGAPTPKSLLSVSVPEIEQTAWRVSLPECLDITDGEHSYPIEQDLTAEDLGYFINKDVSVTAFSPWGTVRYTFANLRIECYENTAGNVQGSLEFLKSYIENLINDVRRELNLTNI